ncbi:Hypothetical protein R9X50_00516500 [Acrodontium crateriforme]|uniref:Uncharacterized protein n=1 Tax=Acrodontium crateriforme TaxID=150365 RepID=A0AAQ3M8V3_9PEZI|nr:Hypothetical protein R9X50_00516500 [Acrodontium crateriforme]
MANLQKGTYVDPNFPNPNGPNDASIIIYGYTPSLAVAVLGIVLFAIALPIHIYRAVKHKTWYFTPVAIGILMEIVGYAFRLLSSQQDPYNVTWFVCQYFFIVVAPVFFSGSIYAVVSSMINIYGRQYAPMPPKVVLGVFITCDVITTIVQIAGAANIGVSYSKMRDPSTANHILLAGLAAQVFSFFLFLIVLGLTLSKARASPVLVNKSFIIALIVATLAVYLRTCFRLAETAEGLMHSLSTHEVYFGCLEFAPIVVAVYVLAYWHPGKYLKTSSEKRGIKDAEAGHQ